MENFTNKTTFSNFAHGEGESDNQSKKDKDLEEFSNLEELEKAAEEFIAKSEKAKSEKAKSKKSEEEKAKEYEEAMNADFAMTMTGTIVVTPGTVNRVIAEWTGLPLTNFSQDEKARFLGLEQTLTTSIIGQPRAVMVVAKSLLRYAAGMRNPDRPIGSFLLIGPTGVGKTELTKKMASYLFGSQKSLIRLDMSEYMEKHTVSRLIGSPPGYVGYEEGGQLTDAVLNHPYSIVLFDEMEKAHPDVFNLLLQILDDGILSDSNGRVVSFANTIIFLTSNMGAKRILNFCNRHPLRTEENENKLKKELIPILETRFRPEFLNRLDEIVIFYPLNEMAIKDISYLMIQDVDHRLAEKGYALLITSRLLNRIREEGFNPAYGARPLRRTITKWLEDPISERLLTNDPKLKKGCTFLLDVDSARSPTCGVAFVLDTADAAKYFSEKAFLLKFLADQGKTFKPDKTSEDSTEVDENS